MRSEVWGKTVNLEPRTFFLNVEVTPQGDRMCGLRCAVYGGLIFDHDGF